MGKDEIIASHFALNECCPRIAPIISTNLVHRFKLAHHFGA